MTNTAIIRTCSTLNEAIIVSELLRSRGMLSSIDNANHIATDWSVVFALGGVHVRIPVSQYSEAKQEIIDQAEAADALLFADGASYEAPDTSQRWKAISMLVIWLGLLFYPVYFFIIWLDRVLPPEWVSKPPADQDIFGYSYGTGLPPDFQGENGLLLLFMLTALLIWELASTKQPKTKDEPQE